MRIRTPDQRLRVFVSSTLEELAPERTAVRAAVERLRLAPVMFELGARPHPPRALYRAYVEQSHIFVGIYWQSYGWVAPEMRISGIEDEYELAVGKPCLVYVKDPAPERQPSLERFFDRIKGEGRVSFKRFETAEELAGLVADDLALLLAEHFETGAELVAPGSMLDPRPLPVPPTRLVGREQDVKKVRALLEREDLRLLTLSGVGGIGKTRLAVAAATEVREQFSDGVVFADLSAIGSADLLPRAVAVAAGISQEGTRRLAELVLERLGRAQTLLMLDNFEHVPEAAHYVARILASCPSLKVLVTSRALLHLRGEHEYRVMSLETPPLGEPVQADLLAGSPAVQLFVERAQESKPEFALDEANAEAVRDLCARLDGIPLAIELAAARVRVLPPGLLLDRIGDRLDLLTGPRDLPERQRTLRATIDWSYDLLEPPERAAFAVLSVFVGGFTLDGADAVLEEDADVLDLVSSLVEKSLVALQELPNAEPRFRMIEVVRQYAADRNKGSGDADESQRRMAEYFAELGQEAAAGLITSEHATWLARLDAEVANLRAAVSWSLSSRAFELGLAVLVRPWVYWWTRGYVPELRPLAERAFEADRHLEPLSRALLLQSVASSRILTGESESAMPLLQELMGLQQEFGDAHGLAMTQAQYAACLPPDSQAEARALLSDASATLGRVGDRWGSAFALGTLGQLLLRADELGEADLVQAEAMDHAHAVGSAHLLGLILNERGMTALAGAHLELARSRFAESARLHRRSRNREGLAYCLDGLAGLALAEGNPELAAEGLGAADAIRDKISVSLSPIMRSLRAPLVTAVQDTLGSAFEPARAAGRKKDMDQVVDELLA